MKKFNIYIGLICSLFLLSIAACDTENTGAQYEDNNENGSVSFLWETSSVEYLPDATVGSIDVIRANTNGALEIPITATYDEEFFTLPASVKFEDGSGKASISFSLEKLELGVTYPIMFAFDSLKVSPHGYYKTTVNVMKDYVWKSAGKVSFESSWAGTTADVPIEYAEGANPALYRLNSPYNILEPDYCPKEIGRAS
ncbi:MAG: hypothetical protein LBQ68_00490, partial [Clostridiales bacterium]|nr:hypothetical protein [Clostridiales bacterium]